MWSHHIIGSASHLTSRMSDGVGHLPGHHQMAFLSIQVVLLLLLGAVGSWACLLLGFVGLLIINSSDY